METDHILARKKYRPKRSFVPVCEPIIVTTFRLDRGESESNMTGASKILTVSYGTFSCTLEGFDDPFSTMRSIAEYFRDLAADDRYFGAEPPTPDAAMLHRIAERSQPGRIEAQVNEDGVLLRQADAAQQPAPVAAVAPVQVATPTPAPTPTPAAVAAPVPGTVADKLSRIRAVVARSGGDLGGYMDDDTGGTPEFAPDVAPESAANATGAPKAAPLQLETPVVPTTPEDGYQDEDDDIPSVLKTTAEVEPETPPAPAGDQSMDTPPAPEAQADPGPETSHAEDVVEDEADALSAKIAALRVNSAASEQANLKAEAEALEAARAQSQDAADVPADDLPGSDDSTLQAADQSAVETLIVDAPSDPDGHDSTIDLSQASQPDTQIAASAAALDESDPAGVPTPAVARGDVAVDRILEKTNTEMNEHEGSRRRSAIAHLKAAVAATRADGGRVAEGSAEANAMSQFREDLAKAVRPQRPSANPSGHRDTRPTLTTGASPLMLVSSLRVDGNETGQPQAAIRPRRVANSDESDDADTSEPEAPAAVDFAAFVAQQDARELPELMEAAAAYATHVEGRPHVTRPLVMSRVLEQKSGLKREDALRTFGRLLRDGRIIRIKRGRFAVAEDTRFRAAGNE